MGRRKVKNEIDFCEYLGIEEGLQIANRKYISIEKDQMEANGQIAKLVVLSLVTFMQRESSTFRYLYVDIFGGGSGYEGLKITKPDEFDIDVLMRIPATAGPMLLENNIPGYVNLKLENFQRLKKKNLKVYLEMQTFLDEKNYLLTKHLKSFIQRVFESTMQRFPNNVIQLGNFRFKITNVETGGPAFTLTIQGPANFKASVDLVPCILLDKGQWPQGGFEENPYSDPDDFFIVPKSPKRDTPHIERYWRLSFQKQEREMIFEKQWLKPTIRALKRIRDCLGHKVSSYAIKTLFLHQLKLENPDFDDEIPELWLNVPFSYCVVFMLDVYAKCLEKGTITYFWNKKMDLLEDLSIETKRQYFYDIEAILCDIKNNPSTSTILKYLKKKSC